MDIRVLLLLLSTLAGGKLLILQFQGFFITQSSNILLLYLIGIVSALIGWGTLQRTKHAERTFFWVITVGAVLSISVLWITQIQVRRTQPMPQSRNDGVTQTEVAAGFLLHGINPYQADYRHTAFANFFNWTDPNGDDVGATHFAYPPLIPLLFVPGTWLHQHFGWSVDNESLYMVFFLGLVALLLFAARTWKTRSWIVILLLSNPMSWSFPMSGFNDIVFLFFLVGSIFLITKKRWLIAGLSLGLALASKQTIALSLPFFGIYLWREWRSNPTERRQIVRFILAALGMMLLICLPFFIWSPADLIDDLVRYVSGSIPWSYPISGITVMQYLRVFGIIKSPWTVLPSWPVQLAVLGPLFFFVGRWLYRHAQPSNIVAATSIAMIVAALFTRFGAENYYAVAIQAGIAAWVFTADQA